MAQETMNWTNPSVTNFITGTNPIEFIKSRAREVVISAIQEGWDGPPFDTFKLAEFLKIPVIPRDDINDARLIPAGSKMGKIEFNPNKSRGRIRFSIAHEIAHSLFPDWADYTRNRIRISEVRYDNWQLELLCNIAAAEMLMPIGSALDISKEPVDIDNILKLHRLFEVSVEAICLRLINITEEPCIVFAAARVRNPDHSNSYRIDYSVQSRIIKQTVPTGTFVSGDSLLSRCTAVGFTAKGDECWDPTFPKFHIECVGIPPYPQEMYPRVVGVIRTKQTRTHGGSQLDYIWGDALQPKSTENKIIAHVVNDKTSNWGGIGFAHQLKDRFPFVQKAFREWANNKQGNLALGNIHFTEISEKLSLVSMIAQSGYGPAKKPRIRYSSLEACLNHLADMAIQHKASVHMPRIGSGQAGGNWRVIAELIDEELVRKGIDVTIYTPPSNMEIETQGAFNTQLTR